MKKKTVFLYFILIFCLAGSARAQTVETPAPILTPPPSGHPGVRERTQFFWQPLKNFSAVTLSAENQNNEYTTVGAAGVLSSTAQQTPTYSFIYSYGITRDWAVSLDLSTSPNQSQTNSAGTETDTSTGGPNNVLLTFKNTTPLWRWNLHYGLKISYSLDVDQPASASTQGNNYSGGDAVTPYLGTSYNVFKKSFLGLRGEYIYNAARTVDPNRGIANARQKIGGNQILASAFFEWHIYPFLIDASGNYNWTNSAQSVVSTSLTDIDSFNSSSEDVGFEVFFTKGIMARLDGTLIQVSQIASSTTIQNPHTETEGTFTVRAEF